MWGRRTWVGVGDEPDAEKVGSGDISHVMYILASAIPTSTTD
jgi:hypothetical protein